MGKGSPDKGEEERVANEPQTVTDPLHA